MKKKSKLYGVISVVVLATIFITIFSGFFLPDYFRERGDLYEDFEYAQMYLNDDEYTKVKIEYDYSAGYLPSPSARNTLTERINQYCEKEDVSDFLDDQLDFADTKETYDKDDIYSLTNKYKDSESGGDTVVIHVMYLGGKWEEGNVLGLSHTHNHIIIFKDTITEISNKSPNLSSNTIETSVLIHELGHLLGLVGIGYESDHQVEGSHHCDESAGECVMDASVEVRVGGFSSQPPDDFCVLCQEDLDHTASMEDEIGLEEYMTFGVIAGELVIGLGWAVVFVRVLKKNEGGYEEYRQYYDDHRKKEF
ncbi:MAG: hypothetical protein R6U61_04665 [Thermoplasmata archaeon]